MKALPIQFDESIPGSEKAIYAFLAEKERRSGSMRTVDAYSRTLQRFFGMTGKTPEQITPPDVFGFADGIGPSGRKPAAITTGARRHWPELYSRNRRARAQQLGQARENTEDVQRVKAVYSAVAVHVSHRAPALKRRCHHWAAAHVIRADSSGILQDPAAISRCQRAAAVSILRVG